MKRYEGGTKVHNLLKKLLDVNTSGTQAEKDQVMRALKEAHGEMVKMKAMNLLQCIEMGYFKEEDKHKYNDEAFVDLLNCAACLEEKDKKEFILFITTEKQLLDRKDELNKVFAPIQIITPEEAIDLMERDKAQSEKKKAKKKGKKREDSSKRRRKK